MSNTDSTIDVYSVLAQNIYDVLRTKLCKEIEIYYDNSAKNNEFKLFGGPITIWCCDYKYVIFCYHSCIRFTMFLNYKAYVIEFDYSDNFIDNILQLIGKPANAALEKYYVYDYNL